jgi:hypothetical protein
MRVVLEQNNTLYLCFCVVLDFAVIAWNIEQVINK